MKKVIYSLICISISSLTIISCRKKDDKLYLTENENANVEMKNLKENILKDIEFYPKDIDARDLVQDFLSRTKVGNSSLNTSLPYRSFPVEEGIWLLEASSNYLTNHNLVSTLSDELYRKELVISNYLNNGQIFINGIELTSNLDQLFDEFSVVESDKKAKIKLVDFRVQSYDQNETRIEILALLGREYGGSDGMSLTNISPFDAADEIEQKLNFRFFNRLLVDNGYSPLASANVINQNVSFFTNVSVLLNYTFISPDNEVNYGCPANNCLWAVNGLGGPNTTYPNGPNGSFPTSALPLFENRGDFLISNYVSGVSMNNLGVFDCDYGTDVIVVNQAYPPTRHMIQNITVGNFHAM